jgi:hypothetical protein
MPHTPGEPVLLLDAGNSTLLTLYVENPSGHALRVNQQPFQSPLSNTQLVEGSVYYPKIELSWTAYVGISGSTFPETLKNVLDQIILTKKLERWGYRLPIEVGLGIAEGWEYVGDRFRFEPIFVPESTDMIWTHKNTSNEGIFVL